MPPPGACRLPAPWRLRNERAMAAAGRVGTRDRQPMPARLSGGRRPSPRTAEGQGQGRGPARPPHSREAGARPGLSWEAAGTCPDFRFATWEPTLQEVSRGLAPSWAEGGVSAEGSREALAQGAAGREGPCSPTASGLPAAASAPGLGEKHAECAVGRLGAAPEMVGEVGRWLVTELKHSEPGPGSPSVPSGPGDWLASPPDQASVSPVEPAASGHGNGDGDGLEWTAGLWFATHTGHCDPCPQDP